MPRLSKPQVDHAVELAGQGTWSPSVFVRQLPKSGLAISEAGAPWTEPRCFDSPIRFGSRTGLQTAEGLRLKWALFRGTRHVLVSAVGHFDRRSFRSIAPELLQQSQPPVLRRARLRSRERLLQQELASETYFCRAARYFHRLCADGNARPRVRGCCSLFWLEAIIGSWRR